MAEAAPDGLASLSAQRNRARRSMPPPRHPVAAHVVGSGRDNNDDVSRQKHVQERAESTTSLAPVPVPQSREAAEATDAADATAVSPTSPSPGAGAPVKVTLYVDRESDEFMEAARVEGLVARPKVDISRSAVVRLALRRLMGEMSAAEVKAMLERQEVRSSGPGRKRR